MSAFALLLLTSLAPQGDSTASIEGVWTDMRGNLLFAGNNRIDWRAEDRHYSSMLAQVPDGTLLGSYLAGRDVYVNLARKAKAADTPAWASTTSDLYPHLMPDGRTFAAPKGEVRLMVKTTGSNGLPAALTVAAAAANTRVPSGTVFNRAMPLSGLTLAGKFGDKDATLELEGDPGRTGNIFGSLTYLGKRVSLSGKRIMGRAGFHTFDDSRFGVNGIGYAVWTPTADRAVDIRNGIATQTDQVEVFFRLGDGSTATGVHKVLRRIP